MTDLNGQAAASVPLTKDQQDVVKVLEEILAAAKAGKVLAVGGVTVATPGNFSVFGTLNQMLEVYAGADLLKQHIMGVMMGRSEQQQQQRPVILRPPAGMMKL